MEFFLLLFLLPLHVQESEPITASNPHGELVCTRRTFDIAIDGEGYFQVCSPDGSAILYTRHGRFHLDDHSVFVTREGYLVCPNITFPSNTFSATIEHDGAFRVIEPGQDSWVSIAQLQICQFPRPAGLAKVHGDYFKPTNESGNPVIGAPAQNDAGKLRQGFIDCTFRDFLNSGH
jgi:flagellar basal-body rod protein FlgG